MAVGILLTGLLVTNHPQLANQFIMAAWLTVPEKDLRPEKKEVFFVGSEPELLESHLFFLGGSTS
jgi:hypothetical protein